MQLSRKAPMPPRKDKPKQKDRQDGDKSGASDREIAGRRKADQRTPPSAKDNSKKARTEGRVPGGRGPPSMRELGLDDVEDETQPPEGMTASEAERRLASRGGGGEGEGSEEEEEEEEWEEEDEGRQIDEGSEGARRGQREGVYLLGQEPSWQVSDLLEHGPACLGMCVLVETGWWSWASHSFKRFNGSL